MPITLDELALGSLERLSTGPGLTARLIGVANVSAMPEPVRRYLLAQAEDIRDRSDEYGRAQKGWWDGGQPPTELAGLLPSSSVALQAAATSALGRLTRVTPGTAKPGLIAMLRVRDDARAFLCVLKLEVDERELYRFTSARTADAAIAYEYFEDVLPAKGSLHKAALIPHPTDTQADARVLDLDYGDDTARYWLDFLGVRVVPPLTRIARTTLEYAQDALESRIGASPAREAVERVLVDIAASLQPTSPRDIVNRAAARSGVGPDDLWAEVSNRITGIFPGETAIAVSTLERVLVEITFRVRGQKVTVRGPADALAERYMWRAVAGGYELTITTDDEPQPRRVLKSG